MLENFLRKKYYIYDKFGDFDSLPPLIKPMKLYPLPEIKIEPIKTGDILPGGLTIKDVTKNTVTFQQDFNGVGNIYTAHPDGGGATRFYSVGEGKKKITKDVWQNHWLGEEADEE